ncbi:carboxymuconolactone decarboxylase family protein [Alkalibacillus aidingensis]|uniref:carboxymuconolactone decarboxylase family protein n=1 Tax=Alkalibacillus aidingensis TaxID=2747607 RepID=UPI0016616C56|nr:carboxymuconolactone decarboxylase family protein [Alkalibacillus aidingensis]
MENFFDDILLHYKEGTQSLKEHLPKVTEGYFDFTEAAFEDGSIDKKHKQLIALGISIYAQDEYCIIYHMKGAVVNGASKEEVLEAIGISSALGGGAAFAQAVTLALDAYDHFANKKE